MVQKTVWQGVFNGRFEDRDYAIGVFNNDIEAVNENIPVDRLLIHEAKHGWEPLCELLGKAVPGQPYPRVNEAESFKKQIDKIKLLGRLPWVVLFVAVVFTVYQLGV